MSTLVVNEYNPTWPAKFVEERQRLQAGIGEFVEEMKPRQDPRNKYVQYLLQ